MLVPRSSPSGLKGSAVLAVWPPGSLYTELQAAGKQFGGVCQGQQSPFQPTVGLNCITVAALRAEAATICKEGIGRNGDCHDVGLRVFDFTHPERCAVTHSWSYKGTTHFRTAPQDCLRRPASGTRFCMHTSAATPVKGVKHNFVVVDRLVVPVILGVDFTLSWYQGSTPF